MPLWRLQSEGKTCSNPGRHQEGHFRVNVCGPEVSSSFELMAEAGDGEVPFPLPLVTFPALKPTWVTTGGLETSAAFLVSHGKLQSHLRKLFKPATLLSPGENVTEQVHYDRWSLLKRWWSDWVDKQMHILKKPLSYLLLPLRMRGGVSYPVCSVGFYPICYMRQQQNKNLGEYVAAVINISQESERSHGKLAFSVVRGNTLVCPPPSWRQTVRPKASVDHVTQHDSLEGQE